jgi:hypothetical protein
VNQPADAVGESKNIKVQDESQPEAGEPQVGQDLRHVDVGYLLDGFDFHQDPTFYHAIHSIGGLHPSTFVVDAQGNLAPELQASDLEFGTEACLIRRFQEPRAKLPMNLDPGSDDLVGESLEFAAPG